MSDEAIKKAIFEAYERIGREGSRPPGGLDFPTGAELARSLGYPPAILEKAGKDALESFVGAYPLASEVLEEGGDLFVADLGCGSGLDSLWLSGEGARAASLDASPAMLKRLKAGGGALAVEGFLPEIPFGSCIFTHAITNGVANLVSDKETLASEIFRILGPGGKWLLADVMVLGELDRTLREDPEAWSFCVGGALPPSEWEELCLGAGFREVGIEIVERFMPLGKGVFRALK